MKLICRDCLEEIKNIPNEYIDLIVTDPPYPTTPRGNAGNSGGMLQKEIKEKDIEIEAYKNAIQNISVNFNGTIKSTSKKVSKNKGE
jgi:DNA modification methylase